MNNYQHYLRGCYKYDMPPNQVPYSPLTGLVVANIVPLGKVDCYITDTCCSAKFSATSGTWEKGSLSHSWKILAGDQWLEQLAYILLAVVDVRLHIYIFKSAIRLLVGIKEDDLTITFLKYFE